MEERVDDDLFGPYAPNLNFTAEELFAEDHLDSPINLGDHEEDEHEQHQNQQNSQQQSQQLDRIDWSPLKGKSREIIESLSNAMPISMPSTSSAAISLNPLFSMSSVKTPVSVGIEPEDEEEDEEEEKEEEEEEKKKEEEMEVEEEEEEEEKEKEDKDDEYTYTPEDSSESQSEGENEEEVADDDSDYEPTNDEENEASVEHQKEIEGIGRQKTNKSAAEVRPKNKLSRSTFEGGYIPPNYVEINPINGKRYIRKSQKGISKDCGWTKVVEKAPANDIAEKVLPQLIDDSQNVFRRTKGRWQQNQWKFVRAMPINDEMEIEIKRKYGVYAYVKSKPTNLRCKKFPHDGCPYKMLLRQNCENVAAGFVHLYERNAHNHGNIEAPEGYHETRRVQRSTFLKKNHQDWRYIGRRWTVEQIVAHKKMNGLRGRFCVHKTKLNQKQYFNYEYLHCGFTSFDGQICDYQIRAKKNNDCIDDDQPTFTVFERGKHSHCNTLEDVEEVDNDEEIEALQYQQSTSAVFGTTFLENNVEMAEQMAMENSTIQSSQQNYGLEEEFEEEDNLDQFNLATESISTESYSLIVDVDLLVLIPKIAQSAQALKMTLAEKRKRVRNKTNEGNAQRMGVNKEKGDIEMKEEGQHRDAPLWEGTEMMRKLAERMAENRVVNTRMNVNELAAVEQQPATTSNSLDNENCVNGNIAVYLTKSLRNEQSNFVNPNSIVIAKPIPIKEITTSAEVVKIKWRHIGGWSPIVLYKTIVNEPWVLYGKNGWIYYYKCARKIPQNKHTEACTYRVRVHRIPECSKFEIYTSGEHCCGREIVRNNLIGLDRYDENFPYEGENVLTSRSIQMRKLRNRVWRDQQILGHMEKRRQKHQKEIDWYPIPGEWTREKLYERARDEHGLRLYSWKGLARIYFECEEIGPDGQRCEFKIRAKRIEEKTANTIETADNNKISNKNMNNSEKGGNSHEQTIFVADAEPQIIYKISESICWHNHETTVFPLGRPQYKLINVDLSQWKFVQDVQNVHIFKRLRDELRVHDPPEHFRILRQATLACALKPSKYTARPLKRECAYCVLVFREFKYGPIHVYERGEHKHSLENEKDFVIDGELKRRRHMDERWMPIAERITKEKLLQHAQLHELQQYLRRGPNGWGLIYFKCEKIGSGGRICQFKICGKKAMDRQNGNDKRTKFIGGNGLINEWDNEREENNDDNGNEMLYDLFETKYWHNHECAAPINQKRMPVGQVTNVNNSDDQWILKTIIYDAEGLEEFKGTQGMPGNLLRYYITQISQIDLVCGRKGCKYKMKICREFFGGPLKISERDEHNHSVNDTKMEVISRIGTQNSVQTLIKNSKRRHRTKPKEIAQKKPPKFKYRIRNRSSTILNQLIQRHLDGPQMTFEQFIQAFFRIEREEGQKEGGEEADKSDGENAQEENVREIDQNQDEDEIQKIPQLVREKLAEKILTVRSDEIEGDGRNEEQMPITVEISSLSTTSSAQESNLLTSLTSKTTQATLMALGNCCQQIQSNARRASYSTPTTSLASPIFDNQQEKRQQNESEFLIPVLGQGPSAFRKPSPMRHRSSSMLNFPPLNLPPLKAFERFENDGSYRQVGMSSTISAPLQFNGMSHYSEELPTTSTEIAVQSGADPHFWQPRSFMEDHSEANELDENAMAEQICSEFMDFEDFGNSAESPLILAPILEEQPCHQTSLNLGVDPDGNNYSEEGAVFSSLAPPLSPDAENGETEENECQIVDQTLASMPDAMPHANAKNELDGAEKVVEQNLAIHAEPQFPILSRQEKLRMGALFGSYLHKWKRNLHMKQIINQGRREESEDEIVGKMKTLRTKKKQRRPRGLFITTRGAQRRAEEEKRRRRESVPQRRGAYLDDSSDEDEDRTVENDEDYAFEELEENDIDIITKVVKEVVNFVANDEEMILSDVPSTSQNAFTPSVAINKRRSGQPPASTTIAKTQQTTSVIASMLSTSSMKNRGRGRPPIASIKLNAKETPPIPKHSKETLSTPSIQSRLLIVNISDHNDPRIKGSLDNENAAIHSQGNSSSSSAIRFLRQVELTTISIGQLGKMTLAHLIAKERQGELTKDGIVKWDEIVEEIDVNRNRWARLNRYLLSMLSAMEILQEKKEGEQLNGYLWKGMEAIPTLMASLKSKAEAIQMGQKISSIERKLRKSPSTVAIKTEEWNIFEKKPPENGGQKMVQQMCRRFLMILLCDWAFGSDILCLLMGFELKCRRTLYDVLNVLTELKLVKKLHFTTAASRIPIYAYSGPKPDANPLTATEAMRHFQNRLDFMQNLTVATKNSRTANLLERNDRQGTSSEDTKHEDLLQLRLCLEQGFEPAPSLEPPPLSPAPSISSTGTIAAEIFDEDDTGGDGPNINNSEMSQSLLKASIVNIIQTNVIRCSNVYEPYFVPMVAENPVQLINEVNAVGLMELVDWQRPAADCLADIGAEAVIGGEEDVGEILDMTGEMEEMKEEQNDWFEWSEDAVGFSENFIRPQRQNQEFGCQNGQNLSTMTGNNQFVPTTTLTASNSSQPSIEPIEQAEEQKVIISSVGSVESVLFGSHRKSIEQLTILKRNQQLPVTTANLASNEANRKLNAAATSRRPKNVTIFRQIMAPALNSSEKANRTTNLTTSSCARFMPYNVSTHQHVANSTENIALIKKVERTDSGPTSARKSKNAAIIRQIVTPAAPNSPKNANRARNGTSTFERTKNARMTASDLYRRKNVPNLEPASSSSNMLDTEVKPNFHSMDEEIAAESAMIETATNMSTIDNEADDRRQLLEIPTHSRRLFGHKNQRKRRITGPNNPQIAKKQRPSKSNGKKNDGTKSHIRPSHLVKKATNSNNFVPISSNSYSTPPSRDRGRPFGSTKQEMLKRKIQKRNFEKSLQNRIGPMQMPKNWNSSNLPRNGENDESAPPGPRFHLNDFDFAQLELLGAEWGLQLQKRGHHLLFFKPAKASESKSARILRHTTMGLLLMDNGDHVQVDECELVTDGSYRPNVKPTDRWYKGSASAKKFLRCLYKKMAECFKDEASK